MKKEKELIYEPCAGMTFEAAFSEAIQMARIHGKPVKAIVNDVVVMVTGRTNVKNAVMTFRKKLLKQQEADRQREERAQRQAKRTSDISPELIEIAREEARKMMRPETYVAEPELSIEEALARAMLKATLHDKPVQATIRGVTIMVTGENKKLKKWVNDYATLARAQEKKANKQAGKMDVQRTPRVSPNPSGHER